VLLYTYTHPYSIVVDTLKTVDPDRKCFRMVGGVLVERTVKDVLPALEHNCKQVDSHTTVFVGYLYKRVFSFRNSQLGVGSLVEFRWIVHYMET